MQKERKEMGEIKTWKEWTRKKRGSIEKKGDCDEEIKELKNLK